MFKKISVIVLMVASFASLNAQSVSSSSKDFKANPYWIEMMQDESVNFYDVQNAFNLYWENREVTKGNGWKPYKRWEWWTERHIYPDGTRYEADKTYNAYQAYINKNPQAKLSTGDWENLGPINVPSKGYEGLGRIAAIAFHPTDPNIVYLGAPAGGLWIYDGTPGGWSSTTDNMPTLGVSSIVVDWSNSDNIYMGTGDRDAGDAAGMGIFKSTDGGLTWQVSNTGMGNTTVGRMIQHPTNPDVIYAASSAGVFKTENAGSTWNVIKPGGSKDIIFKPNNPSVIYVGGSGNFYKSSDSGQNWVQITNGLPSGSRSVIAVSPADPEVVYCLLSNGDSYKGIYRSANSGESFTEMSTTPNIMSWGCTGGDGGQAWYDLDIAVDPINSNIVFAGGVNCFKSVDGGVSWNISSHWWGDCSVPAVHADLHILEYNPLNNRLYAGNDGGIYFTENGGNSWPELTNGLPISQAYRIGQCAINKDKVINGYQDNGTSTYYGNNNWQTTYGGDGMECAFDHTDEAYSYATLYYGDIFRLYNNGNSHKVGGNGAHGMTESGGWVTPFCLHEGNSEIMFGGFKNIWRAEGVKTNSFTWKKITDFGGNDINVVEHSPADYNLFYFSVSGQLYRSDNVMDDNPDWITLTNSLPGSGSVLDIEAHPFNADVVYITRSNKVFVSENRGMTWVDITGSLPNINLNSLAAYKNSIDGIYIGADAGVYYRDASMDDWVMFSNGLPVDASVNEIEIYSNPANPAEDVIRAGTYGRGLWSSPVWHGQLTALFEADLITTSVGCAINFFDLSEGVPTSWQWTFTGADPSTSNEKNPQDINYISAGVYDVTLTVSNSEGTDTQTISGYIEVAEASAPDVVFTVSETSICAGSSVQFIDLSTACPTTWQWSFNPPFVNYLNGTNSISQNPEVSFMEETDYTVTLVVGNGTGTNSLTKESYISNGGLAAPFFEDFESGSLNTKSWTVVNPDFGVTWGIADVSGGTGTKAAIMNFYDYIVPPGGRDKLLSPILNLSDFDDVYLSFKHAYAKRHPTVTDSLIVKISGDCGNTWTRIFEGGEDNNGSFATHELIDDPFVPALDEDWCGAGFGADCNHIDISEWAGSSNVRIMFETYNYFGNNLYLDDVMVGPFTKINENKSIDQVLITPNPSSGIFNVNLPEKLKNSALVVYNAQGVEVMQIPNPNEVTDLKIDLSSIGRGIYFVRIAGNGQTQLKKLIVK